MPGPLAAMLGGAMAALTIAKVLDNLGRDAEQVVNRLRPNAIPTPAELTQAAQRQLLNTEEYRRLMSLWGFRENWAQMAVDNSSQQIDTLMLVSMVRREIIEEAEFTNRMNQLGWNDVDIERIMKATEYYPPATDLIEWVAHEVYEPDSIQRYGLDAEMDLIDRKPFKKGGVTEEQLRNYWIAHWNQPSWTQVQRFFYAGIVDGSFVENDVEEWFRLVEIPAFWRQYFMKTIYEPLTRVDVRRMWEMGVLDDDEVKHAYQRLGYSEFDAVQLVKFTKIERSLPQLRERYKKGWLSKEDLVKFAQDAGLDPDHATRFMQRLVDNEQAQRVEKERDLTKAEIIRGWKREALSGTQVATLLRHMGYSDEEVGIILRTENITDASTPTTALQLQQAAVAFAAMDGRGGKAVPQELLDIESRFTQADAALLSAINAGTPEVELAALRSERQIASDVLAQRLRLWEAS